MVHMLCPDFQKEPSGPLATPRAVIQGFVFEDLGGVDLSGKPFGPTANLSIFGHPQKGLFIGQGKVKVYPTERTLEELSEALGKKVSSFQVSVLSKHYFGSGQPIVTAYDCDNNQVDKAQGTAPQGVHDKLLLIGQEICYIVIHGTEASIEKLCFLFV